MRTLAAALGLLLAGTAAAQTQYDTLLKGGHVIDPRNEINAVRDVAVKDGKIARVAANIPASEAEKVVDVTGLYVTPGLIDIHVHVYAGTGARRSYNGDSSIYPDGFTFRSGVTTVVDVGSSGWRQFEDFKDRIIDRSQTRVLSMLNITGSGMTSGPEEHDTKEFDAKATADMAKKYPGLIVGVKSAHYRHSDWTSVERAVEAGTMANIPVMVDFGSNYPDTRPLADLLTKKLRPGDIYTHCFAGNRDELNYETGKINPGMFAGRERGVKFDVGHGGGSFRWEVAVAAIEQGFPPDSISTDLHVGSMNSGMKSMIRTVSKIYNLGVPLYDVVKMSTSNPASEIKRTDLGHLSEGAVADVAVFRDERGVYGFADARGARYAGDKLLECELTLREGDVVWDLNGRAGVDWEDVQERRPGQGRGQGRGRGSRQRP
ncbi:MAG: amidohydrolase/deacetylase family metallohydrolase [Acidobacteria bacterium]|nr:amidohydrolase/deacetylase family metallohydrolase [Acidobacteriota bacterium]